MNRKQKKVKRLKATFHKVHCNWLKGGNPRKFRKKTFRGILSSKGIRVSRRKLRELSDRTIQAYLDAYDSGEYLNRKKEDFIDL